MTTQVRWRKFKSYSGPQILGNKHDLIALMRLGPSGDRRPFHADRAYWLTTAVESGERLGSIVMYDGTGVTAGLDQHVAVYPRELAHEDYNAADDQGSLWGLLRRMEVAVTLVEGSKDRTVIGDLWKAFEQENWYVSQDGRLRYLSNDMLHFRGYQRHSVKAGDLVFGFHIREVFTSPGGAVPSPKKDALYWRNAKEWAELFHDVFGWDGKPMVQAQVSFGIEHLVKRTQRRRIRWPSKPGSMKATGELSELAYGGREVSSIKLGLDWSEEMDLALCMYQAHSVNAPAIANKAVARARSKHELGNDFAKALIQILGNNPYGRWDDDIKNGRYQRTRSAARASGLWSRSLFDGPKAIMPKDLPG